MTISIAAASTRTNYTKLSKPGFHWSLNARESRLISSMRKSQPARHGPCSYSTSRPADSGSTDVSPLIFLDEDGGRRTSAEVPASRGSYVKGTRASRPARGPKGYRHRRAERTYAAVRRRSSHARELIRLAHAGMDRACCDKPVRAAGKREICRREQSDVVRPWSTPQRCTPYPMPPLLPHRTLCLEMP